MFDDMDKRYRVSIEIDGGDLYRLLTAISVQITMGQNDKRDYPDSPSGPFRVEKYEYLHKKIRDGIMK